MWLLDIKESLLFTPKSTQCLTWVGTFRHRKQKSGVKETSSWTKWWPARLTNDQLAKTTDHMLRCPQCQPELEYSCAIPFAYSSCPSERSEQSWCRHGSYGCRSFLMCDRAVIHGRGFSALWLDSRRALAVAKSILGAGGLDATNRSDSTRQGTRDSPALGSSCGASCLPAMVTTRYYQCYMRIL